MRKCAYCGKEYADDAAVCLVDKTLLINPEGIQANTTAQRRATGTSFSVKVVSPLSSAGTYRVFVERGDLLFICVEGVSRSILDAAVPLLGPFGGLISLVSWLWTKRKTKTNLQRLDESDPEELLRGNDKNFKLHSLASHRNAIKNGWKLRGSLPHGRV